MTAFPQYARTTDPKVLDTVRRNKEGFKAFRERAFAFSSAQGAPDGAYYGSSFAGSHAISAIGGDEKPTTGRWKEGYRRGWVPFKNNPLSKEMDALRFDEEKVPGLPQLLESASRDGSRRVGSALVFILDDVAYSGLSFVPEDPGPHGTDPADGSWEEIKASEFHKAMETYNERLQSDS